MMHFPYSPSLNDAIDRAIELLEETPYTPGAAFLTQDELAHALKISPALAAETLLQMHNLGLIEDKGDACRVAQPKYIRSMWSMSSLSEAVAARHQKLTSRVVVFEITEAPKIVSMALSLSLGERVYRLLRVRTVGQQSLLEDSYLPVSMFDGLLKYDFAEHSLYHTLDKYYRTQAVNQSLEFLIEMPTPKESELLGISPQEPMLVVSGPTWNQNGIAFEYSIAKSPGAYTCCEARPLLKGLL